MGGLRFSVWTLPWETFQQEIADLPVPEGSGRGTLRMSDFAAGQLAVPNTYPRLTEIVSATAGRLVRVYDGSTLIHEWLAERVDYEIGDNQLAVVAGDDLASAFDRAIVYPFDYTVNPSLLPDHVWGGSNILSNPGFEKNAERTTIYELWNDGAGLDEFTLTDGTDTTLAILWNASALTVENRLETDITAYDDVLVTGSGTETDPWRIEFVTPFDFDDVTLDYTDTGMTSTLTLLQYGALQPAGWTKSQAVSRGVSYVFGEYTNFVISTAQARTGTYSLAVNPKAIGRKYAGAQQVLTVTPGATYQASIWIYPTSATDEYRFVIRGIDEDYIASDNALGGTSYTASTWTQVTISDVVIPDGVTQIIFRFANVDQSGDPAIFYLDDAEFKEGAAPAKMGVILTSLMDDAAVDHAADTRGTILDWVDYTTWTATLDSSSTAWTNDESFTAFRGATYGQTWDRIRDLGYEWRLVAKASPGATTHDLEWYERGNMGTNYSAAGTPSIVYGQGTRRGRVVRRIPNRTAVLVEGAEGVYSEANDATALANFGRLEKYRGDTGLTSSATIGYAAQELLDAESGIRDSIQVTVVADDRWPRPLVDYQVGDTVNVTIPPYVATTPKRVSKISYQNTDPVQYQIEVVEP